MVDKTIGLLDLQRKALELLEQSKQLDHSVVHEFLKYAHENYEHLTPEAAAAADRLVESLKLEIGNQLKGLPNSPETKQAKRLYARAMRNWDAAGLIGALEAASEPKHPIIAAARPLFERHLQHYLDLLCDVAEHTHSGRSSVRSNAHVCLVCRRTAGGFPLGCAGIQ